MRKINAIIVYLFLSALAQAGVHDSLILKIHAGHHKVLETVEKDGVRLTYSENMLDKKFYFSYRNNTDLKYAARDFNDSAWTHMRSDDARDFEDNDHFKGEATFRLHYRFTTPALNKLIVCDLFQEGASEIYIDGKQVKRYGRPGHSAESEEILIPRYDPFYVQHNDTVEHVITILYSNYNGIKGTDNLEEKGLELKLFHFEDYEQYSNNKSLMHEFLIGLFAFFFALAIAHFFLFFADKTKRFNVFYALFLLMVSLTSIRPVISAYSDSPGFLHVIDAIAAYFIPCCLFFLLNLVYSLFKKKFNFFYYLQAGFFGVFVLGRLAGLEAVSGFCNAALFFATYIGVTIIAIKALRHKYHGANYLGWGVLLFTIFFILGIVASIVSGSEAIVFISVAASILSLPLSMTAYLSHDFAVTSKSLKLQLETNDALSKQTIRQEKEKQELLANQNKLLEEQVQQRTHEIADQNKVLEHQKKEITDSINYAKRIQQALLPDLHEIEQHLPGSFIFYQPKDIVSGDFYFFQKKNNAVYIAAADCTGHGVPGALMSMIVHEKLGYAVEQFDHPAEILRSINSQVKDALKQNQGEHASRDGCDIAICRITPETVTYAGAFRPLYAFNKQNELSEIKATKTAIAGLTPYDQVFGETVLPVKDLKVIYMFSDGYADQFGGAKTKKLTTKKFKELLGTITDLPVREQHDRLRNFFSDWSAGVEQIDDVLVIGIVF